MHRLEGNLGVTEALLQTEKEQNASTLKLLSEAQLRIEDLIKKLEGADRKSDSLQDTIKRSVSLIVSLPPPPLLFFWLFQ
jgi:myosin-5